MDTTSVSLLERLRRQMEPEAWTRFVQLYTPMLYGWARGLGLQENDAADLLQEVFVQLLQKMPLFAYDPQKSFRAWLWAVLANKWREFRRRRVAVPVGGDAAILTQHPGPDESDLLAEAEYRRLLVQRALQLMRTDFQPSTWKACWAYVVEDRPAAEVAAELGIKVGEVYVAKSRVLRRLRRELAGLLD